jgi:hypothetical protein
LFGAAGIALAATFDVANYSCTDLYGVPYNYNPSNPVPNFMAFSLTDGGTISGVGWWADLTFTGGSPPINPVVALQCGPAGFGPMSFSGSPFSGSGITSNNANYTSAGLPTTGFCYNTDAEMSENYFATVAGNDSGTLAFAGSGNGTPGWTGYTGTPSGGHYWSSGGGYQTPAGFTTAAAMWVNSSGVVAGGDCGDYNGTGNYGEVYNPATHTTTTMPGAALFINDAGQVCGTANNCTQAWVWNSGASTYWPAGSTTLPGSIVLAQAISQNGRYVAGDETTAAALYDASSQSIVETISGEATTVNNNGWLGGDTDPTGAFGGTAWLWDGTTVHNLDSELKAQFPSMFPSNETVCGCWGLNDSDQFLVWAYLAPYQAMESYLLTPVPEPSSIALLLASAACLSGYAWRRRRA